MFFLYMCVVETNTHCMGVDVGSCSSSRNGSSGRTAPTAVVVLINTSTMGWVNREVRPRKRHNPGI